MTYSANACQILGNVGHFCPHNLLKLKLFTKSTRINLTATGTTTENLLVEINTHLTSEAS